MKPFQPKFLSFVHNAINIFWNNMKIYKVFEFLLFQKQTKEKNRSFFSLFPKSFQLRILFSACNKSFGFKVFASEIKVSVFMCAKKWWPFLYLSQVPVLQPDSKNALAQIWSYCFEPLSEKGHEKFWKVYKKSRD